jgi:hypothetical protein
LGCTDTRGHFFSFIVVLAASCFCEIILLLLILCVPALQKVVVMYYLADDSVQVTEPKQDNSGIPQVS